MIEKEDVLNARIESGELSQFDAESEKPKHLNTRLAFTQPGPYKFRSQMTQVSLGAYCSHILLHSKILLFNSLILSLRRNLFSGSVVILYFLVSVAARFPNSKLIRFSYRFCVLILPRELLIQECNIARSMTFSMTFFIRYAYLLNCEEG